ncbi:MAG TPA: hypothetical protein DEA85_08215 [Firmicutes bacterium]|nr:hypothetical protein [Bacillota bacterium]
MSEEQKIILDMLSEGKITVEEAQKLLENLGGQPPKAETPLEKRQPPMSIMENIVETLRSGLANFSFGIGDVSRIVLEESHTGSFSSRQVELDLDVRNGTLRVEPSEDGSFHLEVIKRVNAGTREQAEEIVSGYKFADYDGQRLKAGDSECRNLGNRVNISLRLRLPAGHVYAGRVVSKNGAIDISAIDVNGINLSTVNGAVRASKVTGADVSASTVNGSISLEGGLEHVEARTTNGSISLFNMAEDSRISLKTVNGRIKVQLPAREDIGFAVDARATSGNVRLEHSVLTDKFSVQRLGAGRKIDGTTDNWDYAQHKISLYLRSVNGSIGIQELE